MLHTATPQTSEVVLRSVVLTISCAATYWLITHILTSAYSVSREDDMLGGMWAVVSTVVVYRYSQEESFSAALSRVSATFAGFLLCLVYVLLFPFHVWGMAALIGIGAIAMRLLKRPDDTITTGVTVAVLMVISALNPHNAWREPILRLVDTVLGVTVGMAGAWVANALCLWNKQRR
jgi:uncharacterized membrane protein YccC